MKKYKFTNQVRSKAVAIANSLRAQGWNFSDALRQGWKVAKATNEMKKGEIVIRFFTSDSPIPEQRFAVAITSKNYTSKNSGRKRNPLQISYFDTVKQGIRSFNAARFDGFAFA